MGVRERLDGTKEGCKYAWLVEPYSVVSHCDTMKNNVTRVISRTKREWIVINNYSTVFGKNIYDNCMYEFDSAGRKL